VPVLFGLQTGEEQASFAELEATLETGFDWVIRPDTVSMVALDAIVRLPEAAVVAHVLERCTPGVERTIRLSGLRVLGALASPRALDEVLAVARGLDDLELGYDSVRRPLKAALSATLGRDEDAWRTLGRSRAELDAGLLGVAIEVAGELGAPASVAWLSGLLTQRTGEEVAILAGVAEVAEKRPWVLDVDLRSRVAGLAGHNSPLVRARVVSIAGHLRAMSGFDLMVGALAPASSGASGDASDAALASVAAWGLHEISGVAPRTPTAWRAWRTHEEEWWATSGKAHLARLEGDRSAGVAAAMRELSARPWCHERVARAVLGWTDAGDDELAVLALQTLQRLRAAETVPELVSLLDHPAEDVSAAAHAALVALSGRDLGASAEAWRAWLVE
jgi:hypothetical protein